MAGGGGGRPIRALNVAEKPSVAKTVAGILSKNPASGGLRVRDGRSRYNKIFEFNYTIDRQPFHMLFTSVTGHLMELDFDDRYRKWHSCDPADLYHAPVKKYVPQDKSDIRKTLVEEARKCQWLFILWLDCDHEGENIAFEVIEVCTRANRNLNIERAHFSALIDSVSHGAAENLDDPNQLQADSIDVQQEIKLQTGASFTRFRTMLLRDAFVLDFTTDETNVVLSYGPCEVSHSLCCSGKQEKINKKFHTYSSLRWASLWKGSGKSNHMNLKNSGLLIVLIIQKKALLHLIGCNYHSICSCL